MKAWFDTRGRGPVDIQPGRTGQFDVVVNGQVAFSRYETGRFPSDTDLANIPA
ncbi:MAG: Rdx family protein [Burkholderiaceae bacterium]